MKCFFLASALLASAPAFANQIVVNAAVTLERQPNPNGECGASTYGIILDGFYNDAAGTKQTVHGCVESIVVPLDASECLVPKKPRDDLQAAVASLRGAALAKDVVASLLLETDGAGFTILNLTATCQKSEPKPVRKSALGVSQG